MEKTKWSENVILVDADYVDAVAFNLIVNFERMLFAVARGIGRRERHQTTGHRAGRGEIRSSSTRDFGPDRRQGHHVAGHGTSGGERIPSGDSRLLVDECVGHQGRRNLRLSENRPNLFESAEREQII